MSRSRLRFIVIGTGWRGEFYVRAALRHSERFEVPLVYTRRPERVEELSRKLGVPVSADEQACLDFHPDFAVVAVRRGSGLSTVRKWAGYGLPILAETPAAETIEDLLALWDEVADGRIRLQEAEQYILCPSLAAVDDAIASGRIGELRWMYFSRAHGYHGASLIRHFLRTGFENVTISGHNVEESVLTTGDRYGMVRTGEISTHRRQVLTMDFESGKHVDFDFDDVLYHSSIRSYRIVIQGEYGEIENQTVRWAEKRDGKIEFRTEHFGEGTHFQNWFREDGSQIYLEDEEAIARLMSSMDRVGRGEDGEYPIAEAFQDTYLWLLMEEAAATGKAVHSSTQAWARD